MTDDLKALGRTIVARTLLLACVLLAAAAATVAEPRTENVILVTFDGLRWQELFGGADSRLLDREHGGVRDLETLKQRFWRQHPEERRKLLLPFFWGVVAQQGQVFGDPQAGSVVHVTNGLYFSYPGYNEILSGRADPHIDSNAKRANPNLTVLEALQERPDFAGRVAVFGSWDVFPYVLNQERSGVYVNAGWQPLEYASPPSRLAELNALSLELPHTWHNVRYDAFTFEGARGYLAERRPRVLYVAFGETDDWAHDGRYDLYLDAAWRTDDYLRRLWEEIESQPAYAGKTSLVLTTDHGRGSGLEDWRSHGNEVPGADRIWIAVIGPDTPALGIRQGIEATQGQVAATLATLLGFDFREVSPQAAPPLPGIQ